MSQPTSDLLMYQIGPRVYGSAVQDVRRVRLLGAGGGDDLILYSELGEPAGRRRGMVVDGGDGGERTLVVDRVLGVRAVEEASLRFMPAFALACLRSTAVIGFALLEETPTLLIDLPTLIRERYGIVASSPAQERPDDG